MQVVLVAVLPSCGGCYKDGFRGIGFFFAFWKGARPGFAAAKIGFGCSRHGVNYGFYAMLYRAGA